MSRRMTNDDGMTKLSGGRQGLKPIRGFGGEGGGGDGLRICISLLKDLNNGDLVRVQSGGELFLERSQFLRKLTRAKQRFAHLDEGADDPFDSAQGRLPRSSERRADCEGHLQPEVRRAQ